MDRRKKITFTFMMIGTQWLAIVGTVCNAFYAFYCVTVCTQIQLKYFGKVIFNDSMAENWSKIA